MRQMKPHASGTFGRKVIFSISDILQRFKESISRFPANFKKISKSQIFDLLRLNVRFQNQKLAKIGEFDK